LGHQTLVLFVDAEAAMQTKMEFLPSRPRPKFVMSMRGCCDKAVLNQYLHNPAFYSRIVFTSSTIRRQQFDI
jgi:hypothetical protein